MIDKPDRRQKRTVKAENEQRTLDVLLDHIPEAVVIADVSDLKRGVASRYAKEVSGRSSGVIERIAVGIDAEGWCIFRHDGVTRVHYEELPLVRAGLNGETVIDEEMVLSRPDGSTITFLCNAGPIRDRKGNITGAVSVWKDISERKCIEDELRKAREELEERVQERTFELTQANDALRKEIAWRIEAEQALNESQRRLRLLSARLLNAQEEERQRIAIELHDSIASSLVAIVFGLERSLQRVEKGEIIDAESLGALVNLARYAIEDSRRIMMDLRPTVLDDLGLIPTIVWYCKQKESVYRNITIIKEIGIEESQIDERLKTVIFRIIQEGLNNVLKHSRADVVNLSITMREGTVVLSIADNGVGFDVETALRQDSCEKGLGLLSMRERTELSGGTFSIASFMGKGTTVQATWALTMIGNCRFDTP